MIDLVLIFLLRAGQALMLSLPTLLLGMLVAGALPAVLGGARIKKYFGSGRAIDLFNAYALALLMPVCSIGVLPVLFVLRGLGACVAPLAVIALAAPLVMPWTPGFLIDRTGAGAAALLVVSNAIISLSVGLMLWWFDQRETGRVALESIHAQSPFEKQSRAPVSPSLMQWAAHSGRAINLHIIALILIAFAGVGVLALLIPPNAVGDWLVERNVTHAVLLSGMSILSYTSPERLTMQAGEIVQASTMPGLVVVMVAAGSAVHAGLLLLGFRVLGFAKMLAALLVLGATTVACGLMVDAIVFDPKWFPDDSHAFEEMGRPFHLTDHPDGAFAGFMFQFGKVLTRMHVVAGVCVLVLMIAGRFVGSTREKFTGESRVMSAGVGRRTLMLGGGLYVVVVIVVGVYAFYPPPTIAAGELRRLAADLDSARRSDQPNDLHHALRDLRRRVDQLPMISVLYSGRRLAIEQSEFNSLRTYLKDVGDEVRTNESDVRAITFRKSLGRVLAKMTE